MVLCDEAFYKSFLTSPTMLLTLFLIYLIHCASGDEPDVSEFKSVIPTCSDIPGTRMSFTPEDDYKGRYRVEYCTEQNAISAKWMLELAFIESMENCNARGKAHVHSTLRDYWISEEHNCTDIQTVCVSAVFDLIFSACYAITSSFLDQRSPPTKFYFNVTNTYSKEDFHKNHAIVDPVFHKDDMSITWHSGVPLSKYRIDICNDSNPDLCELVPNCTTMDPTTIECHLAPAVGCYRLYLLHDAPWDSGLYSDQAIAPYDFCRNATGVGGPVEGSAWGGWAWAAAGGCLLLGAGAAAARRLQRALRDNAKKNKVLARWLMLRYAETPAPAEDREAGTRSVLVLYARECAAASRAVDALVEALRDHVDGQVYDIFSPAVTALCGGAPAGWVRGVLARRDVAVLLLQSPALQLLRLHHGAAARHHTPAPAAGLAVRAVAARAPAFGDSLVAHALQLIAENVAQHADYRKYYIATISALPTDILPNVVPFRRYRLPEATGLLLREISGAPEAPPSPGPRAELVPPAPRAEDFATKLGEFVDYARDHPGYLRDQYEFLET